VRAWWVGIGLLDPFDLRLNSSVSHGMTGGLTPTDQSPSQTYGAPNNWRGMYSCRPSRHGPVGKNSGGTTFREPPPRAL
jgi:hypothetical protein